MTPSQQNKKEEIVKSMKKKLSSFRKRYGKDAKNVMYGTATKLAMSEATSPIVINGVLIGHRKENIKKGSGIDTSQQKEKIKKDTDTALLKFHKKRELGIRKAKRDIHADLEKRHTELSNRKNYSTSPSVIKHTSLYKASKKEAEKHIDKHDPYIDKHLGDADKHLRNAEEASGYKGRTSLKQHGQKTIEKLPSAPDNKKLTAQGKFKKKVHFAQKSASEIDPTGKKALPHSDKSIALQTKKRKERSFYDIRKGRHSDVGTVNRNVKPRGRGLFGLNRRKDKSISESESIYLNEDKDGNIKGRIKDFKSIEIKDPSHHSMVNSIDATHQKIKKLGLEDHPSVKGHLSKIKPDRTLNHVALHVHNAHQAAVKIHKEQQDQTQKRNLEKIQRQDKEAPEKERTPGQKTRVTPSGERITQKAPEKDSKEIKGRGYLGIKRRRNKPEDFKPKKRVLAPKDQDVKVTKGKAKTIFQSRAIQKRRVRYNPDG